MAVSLSALLFPAYVDPGVTGVLFQLAYVAFYAIVGAFAFLGRPFQWLRKKKEEEEETEEQVDDDSGTESAVSEEEITVKEGHVEQPAS